MLTEFRRIAKEAPDELTTWVVMRKAPPLPFLPTEWHGKEVLIFAACYSGDMQEGEKAVKALRALGKPIVDVISPHPFTGWQTAFDPLLTPGARNYWKSHDFADLSDAAIKAILSAVRTLPSPECEVFIAHVGGAMARVPANATAWPNRNAHFIMNAHTAGAIKLRTRPASLGLVSCLTPRHPMRRAVSTSTSCPMTKTIGSKGRMARTISVSPRSNADTTPTTCFVSTRTSDQRPERRAQTSELPCRSSWTAITCTV